MPDRKMQMSDMHPLITEKLAADGEVIFTITGNSMAPMLHHRRDQVCLTAAPEGLLKKYDFPLFIREPEGKYITHRVVSVNRDGTYNMLGDNQWHIERNIRPDQIIGVVKGFWRGGRYISCDGPLYRLYCRVWWILYPVRYVVLRGRGAASRLRRRFH